MPGSTLVLSIGNTSTRLGLYRSGRVSRIHRLSTSTAKASDVRLALDEITSERDVGHCVAASVVPEAPRRWNRHLASRCKRVCWVDHRTPMGMTIRYPRPETIGADRLAAAAGAAARYGTPVIVADFGTALTFSVVSAKQAFIGGIIVPGMQMMTRSLAEHTALLPKVDLAPVRRAVGRSTEESIRIGARYGYPAMVQGLLDHLLEQFPSGGVRIVATGGDAMRVVKWLEPGVVVDKHLALFGLGHIGESLR